MGNRAMYLHKPQTPEAELRAAMDSFFEQCEGKNLSPGTLRFYRDKLLAFTRYLEREHLAPPLADVTPKLLRDFFKKEATRRSPAQARHCYATLRAFCHHLVRDGWLSKSPLDGLEAPRVPSKMILAFSEAQLQALLATCGRDFIGVRDRAIILILLDCGLRASELLSITDEAIDLQEETLTVMGKGAKERCVPFGAAAKSALREYLRRREGIETPQIFVGQYGEPLTYSGLAQIIRRRGKHAKLPKGLYHPHAFRHTCAVMYLRNGGDVFSLQKLLGHTSLTMTRRYAELSQQDVVEKHRKFSPGDALPQQKTEGRQRIR